MVISMNVLNRLTIKNLKLNKKRAIGTIVGIILSVALICAVSGMVTSFRKTLVVETISSNGYYHLELDGINSEKLTKLELNDDIENTNTFYNLGYGFVESVNKWSPYINVFSVNDEKTYDNLSINVIEGRKPINENEIIISERMLDVTDYEIGDTLIVEVGQRVSYDEDGNQYILDETIAYVEGEEELINTKKYEFKIVGVMKRSNWDYSVMGLTTNLKSETIRTYIELSNPRDYQSSISEILGVGDYDDVIYSRIDDLDYRYNLNNELLRWEVFSFSDSTMVALTSIATIVIIIIIVASVFCIRNSFAISTLEKMKMYGMLASVGATKKQIRKSVIFEGFILGIIGIPLGIISGVLADFILIKIVNYLLGDFLVSSVYGVVFSISLVPIIVSIILGFLTIYLSALSSAWKASKVSPIDNLRNTKEIKMNSKKLKVPGFISKIFKTGGVLAYKNLKRSKKKYRTTVVSLTVSIFVFISMNAFINEGFKTTSNYYTDYDYNIQIAAHTNVNLDYIKKLNNINKSYVLYHASDDFVLEDLLKVNFYNDDMYGGTFLDNCDEHGENCREFIYLSIYALDDNTFKEYCKKIGASYNEIKDKTILYDNYSYYSQSKKKEIYAQRLKYKKNDIISGSLLNEEKKLDFSIGFKTNIKPYGLEGFSNQELQLIVNKEYFDKVSFSMIYISIDSSNPDQLEKDVEELEGMINIYNIDKQAREERAILLVVSIFLYGFIVVITLIGVTNIFNTITSNMELRQKEFAMLKSIGMTKKEFNHMINLETLFYCSKSLIYGIILGIGGSYLIHKAFNENIETSFVLPYKAILIAIIFVFIIVYIIMRYSISKINKQNTIETIRNDNI